MNVLVDYNILDNLAKVIEFGLFLHLKRGCVESDFEEELANSFKAAQDLLKLVKDQKDHRVFYSIEVDDVQETAQYHFGKQIHENDFDLLEREIGEVGCDWQEMVRYAIDRLLEQE